MAALAVGASASIVAGCGQKGVLVLPPPAGSASSPSLPASAAGAAR